MNASLKAIRKLNSELYSVLVWGINARFYERNPTFICTNELSDNDFKKTELTCLIMKDIIEYCESNYSFETEFNKSIDKRVIQMIAEVINNIPDEVRHLMPDRKFLPSKERIIEKRAFDGFRNSLSKVYQGLQEIKISLSRVQLEVLCLYVFDKTYEETKKDKSRFHIWGKKIRKIATDIDKEFADSLEGIFKSLEQGAKNWPSERLRIMAGKMLAKETERLCRAVEAGQYFASSENYLSELFTLIETCDAGFGVSIPKFDKYWNEDEGKRILEINKKQSSEGRNWIRIFLVKGSENRKSNSFKLNVLETAMIKQQLDYGVNVFLIFEEALHNSGIVNSDLDNFDFAIAKIDNCPVLMGTQFEKTDDARGVLHVVETKAAEYFNETLGKLLVQSNSKYIFKPTINSKNALILGDSLTELAVLGLIGELKKIYSK